MKEILFAFLKNQKAAALFKFFKVYKGVVIISEVNDVKSMNVNIVMLSEFDLRKQKLKKTFDFYKWHYSISGMFSKLAIRMSLCQILLYNFKL